MILNQRQYLITKAALDKLRDGRTATENSPPSKRVHPKLKQASVEALRAQIADLEADVKAFEGLQSAKGKKKLAGRIVDLPLLLTQARIARNLTQRELGDRVGLAMQQIQRYEAGGYAKASFERIQEILQALGVKAEIWFELIPMETIDLSAAPAAAGRTK